MDMNPSAKRRKIDDCDSSGCEDEHLAAPSPVKMVEGGAEVEAMESEETPNDLTSENSSTDHAVKDCIGNSTEISESCEKASASHQQMPCLLKVC